MSDGDNIEKMGKELDSIQEKFEQTEGKLTSAKVEAAHAAKSASGVSVVQWTADSKESADTLLEELFREKLVADAQVMDSKFSRMFNKFNRLQLDENMVPMRMFTADNRVPELQQFIKKNNPNHIHKGMAPDIKVSQLTSGSQEYINWIKQQTERDDLESSSNLQLKSRVHLGHRHHHHHRK